MLKSRINGSDRKGIVLFLVLGMLLVVTALGSVVLNIITSQARFTHHQTSRIQAYYAAQAGMNYAFDKLRLGNDPNWPAGGSYAWKLCRSGCTGAGDRIDLTFPASIQEVIITVGVPGSGGTRPISAQAVYTYITP